MGKKYAECTRCVYGPMDDRMRVCDECTPHAFNFKGLVNITYDAVNKPKHYQLMDGVEVKDVRKVLLEKIQASGKLTFHQADLWSRSWEYMTRFMDKNGLEDLEKAQVYLKWLVEDMKK